jgi:hypothetical protein
VVARSSALALSLVVAVWLATDPAAAQVPATPGYGQPAPAYGQPAPAYGQPAPAYGQPAPAYGQPAPAYGQPAPAYGQPAPAYGQPAPAYGQPAPTTSSSHRRTNLEMGTLYVTSVVYGVGLGSWLSAEFRVTDPGLFMITPAVLGVAAPIGAYFLDDPKMHRGLPAAISAGLVIGAGEGLGIASYQYVTADSGQEWGFRGFARAMALGATVGGVAGFATGYYLEPSPRSTALATSGMLWGTVIGSMYGYGASARNVGYFESNDSASLGGLVGFNVGLGAAAALSTFWIPTWEQQAWMWAGAGIGAAASLPVYLFYLGKDAPPAKRGLIFTGTAALLGIGAGAIFSSGSKGGGTADAPASGWASITQVGPMPVRGGLGIQAAGLFW